MRAGTAPDVFQGCCTYFPIWAQEGHVLDLQPYIQRDLDEDVLGDWDAAQYAAFVDPGGCPIRGAQVPRRTGPLLQQGPIRRPGRRVPGCIMDARRVPRRDAPADAGSRWRRSHGCLGRHDRRLVGPGAGASERLGREHRRSREPHIMCHGRPARGRGPGMAAGPDVGRQGDGDTAGRPEPLDARRVHRGQGGHGRGRLVGIEGHPRQGSVPGGRGTAAGGPGRSGHPGHDGWVRTTPGPSTRRSPGGC